MKKWIMILMVAAVFSLGLTGCGKDNSGDGNKESAVSGVKDGNKAAEKLKLKHGEKLYTDGVGFLTFSEDKSGYCTIKVYTEDYEHNGTYNGGKSPDGKYKDEMDVGFLKKEIIEYTHKNVGGADMEFSNGKNPLIGFDVSDAAVDFVYADYKQGFEGSSPYMYFDVHRKTYTRVSTFEG